jgi:UDP-glucuronate 4-epimerase
MEAIRANVVSGFDVIIHLAAKGGVRPSIDDPLGYERTNVIGTINMLELARELNIKQFVFASSSSIYGTNPNVPWHETDVLDLPISPYAATKRAAELHGSVYSHLYGIRFIALRLFTVYGPRQRPDLAIHKFAKLIAAQRPVTLYGNGDTLRDYTYVDDIVYAFKKAMDYDKTFFEVINVGNSKTVSLMDLVESLGRIFEVEPQIIFDKEQPGDVPKTFSDITKARNLLSYNPATPLYAGLEKFSNWFRQEQQKVSAG